MKYIILLISIVMIGCSVRRDPGSDLKDWNYTDEWYYTESGQRLQVYKTKRGKRFVFVLNKSETSLIRSYLKTKN